AAGPGRIPGLQGQPGADPALPQRHGGRGSLLLRAAAPRLRPPRLRGRERLAGDTPGVSLRARAAPGAPPVLRRGHDGPERLRKHRPAHLRPLQPGKLCPGSPLPRGQQGNPELQQPDGVP
ncbi:hypothetical protein HGM15179_020886, partial [Zosterops borbonicus]